MMNAIEQIERDCEQQVKFFTDNHKLIEAQRIGERVRYDIEMMKEIGYCSGIENYSRYFDGRVAGERRLRFWTISRMILSCLSTKVT